MSEISPFSNFLAKSSYHTSRKLLHESRWLGKSSWMSGIALGLRCWTLSKTSFIWKPAYNKLRLWITGRRLILYPTTAKWRIWLRSWSTWRRSKVTRGMPFMNSNTTRRRSIVASKTGTTSSDSTSKSARKLMIYSTLISPRQTESIHQSSKIKCRLCSRRRWMG